TLYITRLSTTRASFLFNDTATSEIYTLSLHDALPISLYQIALQANLANGKSALNYTFIKRKRLDTYEFQLLPDEKFSLQKKNYRSEEHTSELQSRENLVCRLLLEKKNKH